MLGQLSVWTKNYFVLKMADKLFWPLTNVFSPLKYAMSSKEISDSFDGLLLDNRYVCHSILFNITLRLYKILQLLFQEGTRLGAESTFSLSGVFARFLVHTFLLLFCELWAIFVGQQGLNSERGSRPYSLLRWKVPQLHSWVPEKQRTHS